MHKRESMRGDAGAGASAGPSFSITHEPSGLRIEAQGAWTVRQAARIDAALRAVSFPRPLPEGYRSVLDLSNLTRLDTAGAWLIHRTIEGWRRAGLRVSLTGVSENFAILLDEVARRGARELPPPERANPVVELLADAGRTVAGMGADLVALTGFLGAVTATFVRMLAQPWRFRAIAFMHHLEHTGLRAVPIVSLICLLIGAVIMQQGAVQLRPYGAEPFAVNLLGILTLREVGVLLTAIMVAGRSGSAFTAEIGSMKMREEIDAMRALGIDPLETLVLPRLLALIIALPLLTFLGDMMALLGGGLVALVYLDLDMVTYVERLHDAVTVDHFFVGMIKTPFAALIIALVGCREGLEVRGSAESLGLHVTSAVVKAIFLVIIVDAVFAMFLAAIGI